VQKEVKLDRGGLSNVQKMSLPISLEQRTYPPRLAETPVSPRNSQVWHSVTDPPHLFEFYQRGQHHLPENKTKYSMMMIITESGYMYLPITVFL